MNSRKSHASLLGANACLLGACLPSWLAFVRAAARPRETQEAVLAGILRRNASTRLGQTLGFASIR